LKFEEAFKSYSEKVKQYNKKFPKRLLGRKIVDLEYGPDADGDPQLYYLVLDDGIKIGIARVYKDGRVEEEDRTKYYPDGAILRFQFLNWYGEEQNRRKL